MAPAHFRGILGLLCFAPSAAFNIHHSHGRVLGRSRHFRAQASASSLSADERLTADKEAAFNAWLSKSGVKAKDVALSVADSVHGGGLGLRAVSAIENGDVVCLVPFSLCFSADGARNDALVGASAKAFDGYTGAAGLIALQLLAERSRGDESQWAPWIALLPEAGSPGALALPLYWRKEDLAVLEGCSTRPIAELNLEADEDFEELNDNFWSKDRTKFPEEHFNADTWRWALGVALSRSFFIAGATRLVPLLDFCNHDAGTKAEPGSNSAATGGFSGLVAGSIASIAAGGRDGRAVTLTVDQSYAAGEEVCCSYGVRPAAEYLEEHGFVPQGNIASSGALAELVFSLEGDLSSGGGKLSSVKCADDKIDVLEQSGLDSTASFTVASSGGGLPDPAMVQFLRLMVLDGADLFLLEPVFRNELMDFVALPVSETNELAVGALVSSRAKQALESIEASAPKRKEAAAAAAAAASQADSSQAATTPALLAEAVASGEREALLATLGWWARDAELVKQKEFYQERRLKEMGLDKPWSPEEGVESTFSAGGAQGNVDWS